MGFDYSSSIFSIMLKMESILSSCIFNAFLFHLVVFVVRLALLVYCF